MNFAVEQLQRRKFLLNLHVDEVESVINMLAKNHLYKQQSYLHRACGNDEIIGPYP